MMLKPIKMISEQLQVLRATEIDKPIVYRYSAIAILNDHVVRVKDNPTKKLPTGSANTIEI